MAALGIFPFCLFCLGCLNCSFIVLPFFPFHTTFWKFSLTEKEKEVSSQLEQHCGTLMKRQQSTLEEFQAFSSMSITQTTTIHLALSPTATALFKKSCAANSSPHFNLPSPSDPRYGMIQEREAAVWRERRKMYSTNRSDERKEKIISKIKPRATILFPIKYSLTLMIYNGMKHRKPGKVCSPWEWSYFLSGLGLGNLECGLWNSKARLNVWPTQKKKKISLPWIVLKAKLYRKEEGNQPRIWLITQLW